MAEIGPYRKTITTPSEEPFPEPIEIPVEPGELPEEAPVEPDKVPAPA